MKKGFFNKSIGTNRLTNLVYGFTLVEAVLYLAIAGMILYFIGGFAFNAMFGRAKIETIQDVNKNTQSVLDEMSKAVGDAAGINGISQ